MSLLDLQAIDTRLAQIEHARATLPTTASLAKAAETIERADTDLINARTAAGDVQMELTKAEQDVQLVRDRATRNQARLDAGQGTAKDLTALQHELTSLARRQAELEDAQLEVMERADALGVQVADLTTVRDELKVRLAELEVEHAKALADLDAEATEVASGRPGLVDVVGADLVALYDKIREQSGGLAAAELKYQRCGGCRLELTAVDLGRIRKAPADEVLRCEECRRILVRTAESGL